MRPLLEMTVWLLQYSLDCCLLGNWNVSAKTDLGLGCCMIMFLILAIVPGIPLLSHR